MKLPLTDDQIKSLDSLQGIARLKIFEGMTPAQINLIFKRKKELEMQVNTSTDPTYFSPYNLPI